MVSHTPLCCHCVSCWIVGLAEVLATGAPVVVLVENVRNGLCHNELCLLGRRHNLLPRAWMCEVDSVGGLLLVESIICENLSLVFDFLRIRCPRQFCFPVNSSEMRTTSDSAAVVSDSSLAKSIWITWRKLMTWICSLSSGMTRGSDSSKSAKLVLCATASAHAGSAYVQGLHLFV